MVLAMNWVAVARHGPILWENEATGSRKVSRYLPGLWDAIFLLKLSAEIPKSENPGFFRIFTYSRYTAPATDMLSIGKHVFVYGSWSPWIALKYSHRYGNIFHTRQSRPQVCLSSDK